MGIIVAFEPSMKRYLKLFHDSAKDDWMFSAKGISILILYLFFFLNLTTEVEFDNERNWNKWINKTNIINEIKEIKEIDKIDKIKNTKKKVYK